MHWEKIVKLDAYACFMFEKQSIQYAPSCMTLNQTRNNKQLTHAQSRAKICIVCFEKKKALRDITCNVEIIANLRKNVGQNFDISDPRLPTGLCDSCRKSYFSKDAVAKNKTFTIPQ